MTLILLAISLTIAFCMLAYNLAVYALPFAAGLIAFQYVYAAGASFFMSGLAAIGAALGSIALVIAVVGFAKNPALRLVALAIFAIPAAVAGTALVHGIAKHMIDGGLVLNLICGAGGLFIGIAAMLNLYAVGTAVLSR
jgi:hypothetical protein